MRAVVTTLLATCALFAFFLIPPVAAEQGQTTLQAAGGAGDRAVVITLNLARGDPVEYSWSANASVDFTIEDPAGTLIFERAGQLGSGSFEAPANGAFAFGFRNRGGNPVSVQWTINKGLATAILLPLVLIPILVVALVVYILLVRRRRAPPPRTYTPPPPPP